MFSTGQTHQYIYQNALVKINTINVINDSAEGGVKILIKFLCCSEVLAELSKFHTSGRTRRMFVSPKVVLAIQPGLGT